MPIIIPANSASAAGGFDVDNSLRFNSGSSDKLNRSTGVTTTNTKFTLSFWLKLCDISNFQSIFQTYKASNERFECGFNLDNSNQPRFVVQEYTGSYIFRKIFSRSFRDTSAWYHFVIKFDSSEAQANRLRVYINGIEETTTDTVNLPSSGASSIISVGTQNIGYSQSEDGQYFNGYLAEFVLVEATDYAPTDFGEFDEDSGIWKPIDVSGLTFGTNGFYLEFKQSGTGTNASGMGADTSGNTHHFAVNNLTAIDQSTDTCTNNFATWNSLFRRGTATPAFSNGNLTSNFDNGGANEFALTTFGVTTGKWYAEVKWVSAHGNGATATGILDMAYTGTADPNNAVTNAFGYFGSGTKNVSGSASSYGASYGAGDIISLLINCDDNELIFQKNGTSQASGAAIDIIAGVTYGIFTSDYGSKVAELNTGSPPYSESGGNSDGNGYGNFKTAPPSGYFALNTKNLAEYG